MEFFSDHMRLWLVFFVPSLACYLAVSIRLAAKRRAAGGRPEDVEGSVGAKATYALAFVTGIPVVFGLIHIVCRWYVGLFFGR